VRLHHGTLQHPLSRSGKKIRSRALDQKTGDVRDYQITIEEMAKSTGFASDANVHYPLYQFLSEFTHVHIMAIGAYANEKEHRFTIKSDAESAYATVFLASYCTWLLLDLVRRRFTVADASKLMTLSSELRTSLLSGLKSMDFAPQLQELPTSITERLSH
jgi:hypothetical protein